MYRQGDVLIKPVASITPNERKAMRAVHRDKGRVVLAYGEVTGHAHAITKPDVTAFSDPKLNRLFLIIPTGAALEHEEHGTINLPPGDYEVIRQRVYDPFADAAAWVAD